MCPTIVHRVDRIRTHNTLGQTLFLTDAKTKSVSFSEPLQLNGCLEVTRTWRPDHHCINTALLSPPDRVIKFQRLGKHLI